MIDPDTCPIRENDGSYVDREAWDLWWATLTPRERALEVQRQFEHRKGRCCG